MDFLSKLVEEKVFTKEKILDRIAVCKQSWHTTHFLTGEMKNRLDAYRARTAQ